jgi:hypothetical protein
VVTYAGRTAGTDAGGGWAVDLGLGIADALVVGGLAADLGSLSVDASALWKRLVLHREGGSGKRRGLFERTAQAGTLAAAAAASQAALAPAMARKRIAANDFILKECVWGFLGFGWLESLDEVMMMLDLNWMM